MFNLHRENTVIFKDNSLKLPQRVPEENGVPSSKFWEKNRNDPNDLQQ